MRGNAELYSVHPFEQPGKPPGLPESFHRLPDPEPPAPNGNTRCIFPTPAGFVSSARSQPPSACPQRGAPGGTACRLRAAPSPHAPPRGCPAAWRPFHPSPPTPAACPGAVCPGAVRPDGRSAPSRFPRPRPASSPLVPGPSGLPLAARSLHSPSRRQAAPHLRPANPPPPGPELAPPVRERVKRAAATGGRRGGGRTATVPVCRCAGPPAPSPPPPPPSPGVPRGFSSRRLRDAPLPARMTAAERACAQPAHARRQAAAGRAEAGDARRGSGSRVTCAEWAVPPVLPGAARDRESRGGHVGALAPRGWSPGAGRGPAAVSGG